MPDADGTPESYASWELSPVSVPVRSRLYHLTPIGVGSSEVESLTGYLLRLAAAHSVSPFVLARWEIAPVFGAERRLAIERQLGSLMGCTARRLNGLEPEAGRWVAALTTLTGRQELHCLTMRPWAGAIAGRGLQRATLAWCPACYTAWQATEREIYQPLRWTPKLVTVCARHRQPLQDRCPRPACNRPQPIIAPAVQPGHCTACSHWLGEPAVSSPIPAASLAWRCWIAEAVDEMLGASSLLGAPFPPGGVRAVIEESVGRLGSDGPLRTVAHLSSRTIEGWRRGTSIPTLESLLRVCHHLNTTPYQLLTVGAVGAPERDPSAGVADAAPSRRPRGSFDVEAARRAVTAVLTDAPEPLPSVRALARELGYAEWLLRHHLPEECRILVERSTAQRKRAVSEAAARRCAEVRDATVAVHAQGLYPNDRRVAPLLSNPLDLIRPEVRVAWQVVLRELGWQPRKRNGVRIAPSDMEAGGNNHRASL